MKVYALNPYSTHELDELEKEFVQQINESGSVERNPLGNEYINQVGKKLLPFAGIPSAHFFIVKSSDINAFAGPGGYIGINTGLILATENESELAAVMAHELAHARQHHLYALIEHQKQMQIPMLASILASIALGVINPTLGSGAMMASLTGFSQDNINFTRAREKEADRIGIDMLIRAGFNPRAMSAFFKKMQLNTRFYYTANIPAILRSHPLDEDRMAEADNRSLHLKASTHKDSLNYYLFKELIRNSTSNNERQLIEYYKKTCYQTNPVKAACDYGQALTRLHLHAFKEAAVLLSPHSQEGEHNFFFEIALAEAEAADTDVNLSLKRLETLSNTYTTNYALLMAHAEGLLAAGQTEKAVALLLKGSRLFKSDLALCEKLARAQSMNHQKAYAYFTKARCELMQGRKSDALRNLRLVKKMAKKDKYLLARTEALMEEITYMASH